MIVVTTKKTINDFILEEIEHQGLSSKQVTMKAGYGDNYLRTNRRQGSISITAAVNFLEALGFVLAIVPKPEDEKEEKE